METTITELKSKYGKGSKKSGIFMEFTIYDSTGTWLRRKHVPIELAVLEIINEYESATGRELR